jgi:hypothetical protein
MTPLESAVMLMLHDLAETLRLARSVREQGRILETMARALAADMAEVKAAVRAIWFDQWVSPERVLVNGPEC